MADERMVNLYRKIQQLLNSPEVKTDNEIITFSELANACKEEMYPYNYFLYTDMDIIIKEINLKILFKNMLGRSLPYIDNAVPTVDEEGNSYIQVNLVDTKCNKAGKIIVKNGVDAEIIGVDEKHLNDINFMNLATEIDNSFNDEAVVVDDFKQKYPGISYRWDKRHPDPQASFKTSDGFIGGVIDLNDTNGAKAVLTNIEDINLATVRTKEYGELYDYIDFYNDYIQNRIAVNINDLNPLMKSIVCRKLDLGKGKVLKLV